MRRILEQLCPPVAVPPGARRGGAILTALLTALLLVGLPLSLPAQGRFEESTEAEKAFLAGLRFEEEAVALQRREGLASARSLYQKAEVEYRRALTLDPRLVKAAAKAGYVLYILDEPDKAIGILEKARAVDANDPDVKHILAVNLFKKRDYARSIPLLEEVVAKNADLYYGAAFLLGKYYYDSANLQRAEIYFQKYLSVKPDDHKVHGVVGNIYLKQQKFDEALREFKKVIELDPEDLRAQVNVGNIEYQKENFAEAARLFEKILQKDPTKASIHYNLASSYFQIRRYPEAIRFYRSFLRLRPGSSSGHFYLGHAHAALGELVPAVEQYQLARQVQPDHPGIAYRLGLVLARLGRDEEAARELRQAARLAPQDPWPVAQQANLLRRTGRLDEALALHLRLVREQPAEPLFRVFAAESLLAKGMLAEARAEVAEGRRLLPDHPALVEVQARLLGQEAQHFLRDGKPEQAAAQLTAALRLAPEEPTLLFGQALLQIRQGQLAQGQQLLEKIATRMKPVDPAVVLAHGEALALLGRPAEASPLLDRAASALGEGDYRVVHTRALLAASRGDEEAALDLLATLDGPAAEVAVRNQARLQVRLAGEQLAEGRGKQARQLLAQAERTADRLPAPQARQLRRVLVTALLEGKEYGRAQEVLKTLRKDLPADEDLLYLEAYADYRRSQLDRAWAEIKDRPGLRQAGRLAELGRQILHRQAAAQLRRGNAAAAERLLQQLQGLPGGELDAVRHDLALVDWLRGRGPAATAKLTALAARGTVPEAELNLGLLADQRGEKRRAYDLYRLYLARGGGELAATVRELVEAKERVFGFGREVTP